MFLLLNAGSSSLKATLASSVDGDIVAQGAADWAGTVTRYSYMAPDDKERSEEVLWTGHGEAVRRFVFDLTHAAPVALTAKSVLTGVGHRMVHGGPFTTSVRITPELRSRIAALSDLAPLHNPPSLETLSAAEAELPDIPHVAVFDTAFHATLPPAAFTYAVPAFWTREWAIRRYGFHGLSHAYCSLRAVEMLGAADEDLRVVVCHLGHGCSVSAVDRGRCVETTMGFTPLEGLMMGTRCGSVDPGVVLYVQRKYGLSAEQVEKALYRESGLLGVSEVSADMRRVLAARRDGNEQARLAADVYVHRARQAIGAMAVTLGGVDALVFTAGVGEHSAEIRAEVCAGLECLGLELDAVRNLNLKPDADIAGERSRGRILIIRTREDITMLREVARVLEK